ncbi:MAG: hypothetical protein JKZ00_04600 [Flavobacteriaceae bacterium]|nr:hypothetical protein [Flavobacteriaceae bacterium]
MTNPDKRLEAILEVLNHIGYGDFHHKLKISNKADTIDAVASGLNMLCEELESNLAMQKSISDAKNWTQQKNLEQKLINSIIFSQEQDREHFSEDIFEGLGQILAGISFQIHALESKIKGGIDDPLKISLLSIKKYLTQSLENTTKLAKELMPRSMMKYGLVPSIDQYIYEIKTSDLNIDFKADVKNKEINKGIEITVYRVVVAIIEKVKAFPNTNKIVIEMNDDECNLQVKIEVPGHIKFITDFNIKSNDQGLMPLQKRIELQGGQMIINRDAKYEQTTIIIKFESQNETNK